MQNKKYKLTKNTKDYFGAKLFQIEALMSFGSVSKGDLGGWIEKEGNLSMSGNAWVYGNARVYGNAWVSGKLKLEAGFFFGIRYQKEEIKYVPVNDDYELISKGDVKIGTDEPEVKSLVGQEATVEIGGKKYKAVIKSEE